jgi:hypothetical protein
VFQGSALPQELLWQTLPFLLFWQAADQFLNVNAAKG